MAETEEKEREITKAEENARRDGWVPKEEWIEAGGEEDGWVNYPEFNFRGELMGRIKSQTKSLRARDGELDKLGKAIKELGDHNRKIAEVEYKRAIRELKHQKLAAAKEENHEAVLEIEDQIDELKGREKELKANPPASEPVEPGSPPQEFVDWVRDNDWYTSDIVLQGAANAIVADYQTNNEGATPKEVLAYMEDKIKEEFPHKFGVNSRPKKPKVTIPGSNGKDTSGDSGNRKKWTKADLSEEQLDMARTFEARGALKIQEYVEQLAEMGELPAQISRG